MAALPPTERWSDRVYVPQANALRSFDAPGYDTGAQAIAAVIGTFGVRPGNPHPDDPYMFVSMGGLSVKNNDGPTTWIVSAQYLYLAQTSAAGQANPLQNATAWEITLGLDNVTFEFDAFGYPIQTSSGAPPDQLPTETISTLHIRAFKYFPNFSLSTALQYMNRVNNSPIQVNSLGLVPAGAFKCLCISPANAIVLDTPAPIMVVSDFEIRCSRISGDDQDPAFKASVIDRAYWGWWTDTDGAKKPGDFSEPDPTSPTGFRVRTASTLLNGAGLPIDPNVKIGAAGRTPSTPPDNFKLAPTAELRQVGPRTRILFQTELTVDFTPLIASL